MTNQIKTAKVEHTPMMQQYLSLKEEHPDALLFFRLGDFYELFFDDAIKVSKMLEITLTSRAGGQNRIPMCGVPYHAAHGYIQKLVELGKKIAIAEQITEPQKGKTLVERAVTKVITPGTFVQEGTFEASDHSFIAACLKNDGFFAVCYGDVSIGKYYYTDFLKSEEDAVDFLRGVNPVEVVLLNEQQDFFPQVRHYFASVDVSVKAIANSSVVEDAPLVFALLETYLASIRTDCMLSFQNLRAVSFEQFMYMSASTLSSLEIFETIKSRNKAGSLLAMLDMTKTSIGTRMLRSWLGNPLMIPTEIEKRQEIVASLLDDYIGRTQLRKLFVKVYDLERLISRICSNSAQPRELHQLKLTLVATAEIIELVNQQKFHPLIMSSFNEVGDYTAVKNELIAALAVEDIQTLKQTGLFNSGYCQQLDELQLIASGGTQWLLDLEQREKERTNIKNLRIKYNKVFGYFIEISKGNIGLVQESWGYQRKQTLANAERYVTEELKQKEEQILGANERLAQLEKQLFIKLCEKIVPFKQEFQKLADCLARLDVLQSFAEVSQQYRYVRPIVNQQGKIDIRKSRHPIIEIVTGDQFIPNDIVMENSELLLITGPNMAGKSTYMRQLAISAIMHQIGCFVPATTASLPVFDAIFTRIGAQDDLFSGESTFMVEMKEVSNALDNATSKSLLLFDEIGRGTATYDGLALAFAILQYITTKTKAKTLFSTHYHELTELVEKFELVKNVHVSATLQDDKIIFHHQIKPGSIEKSYGVQVAQLAHLPQSVIKTAKELLIVLEQNHPTVDASIVDNKHIESVIKQQDKLSDLQNENQKLKTLLKQLLMIEMDDVSPKQAYTLLEKMQKDIQSNI
ncbi:MAG: DNA mismatch repair protein MutS [Culicoidibacterales bacterium]